MGGAGDRVVTYDGDALCELEPRRLGGRTDGTVTFTGIFCFVSGLFAGTRVSGGAAEPPVGEAGRAGVAVFSIWP